MCGIAGYIGNSELPSSQVKNCLTQMRRRGPDDTSVFQTRSPDGRNVYLLHGRLSIIDLDARANQPYQLESKTLIYNGELYNYIELKQELSRRGHSFTSTSDTEVLMRQLLESGWQGLDQCEGMWAFGLYDKQVGSLLLSRDRFGEKPLYFYRDPGGIYFGSEPKFIFALLGRKLPVNMRHLNRYIVNGYKSLYKSRDTFFEGLEELLPGTVLLAKSGGTIETHRYWEPKYTPDESMTFEDAVRGARERLIRSVDLRLRADVPLAFCMSGGIDSNSLIAIAKKVCGYDVHGFTIVNTDARYEEQDMVEHAVKELGLRHTSLKLSTEGFIDKLRELVRYHDAPVYTITYYTHWLLMESIKQHGYKISISGSAADELFSGYYDHHLAYLYQVRNDSRLHAESRANWMTHIKPIVRNPFLGDPEAFIKNPAMRDHIYLDADDFRSYLREPWSEPFHENSYTDDLLRNRMLNEVREETVPVLLHEDDLNAMYYSIENRSPFLDRKLFEFCFSIPTRHLIRDGMNKVVLRSAMRGIVPDKILDNRRKVGFNAPIYDLLDVQSKQVREYLLDESPVFEFMRRDRIEKLISTPRSALKESESKFLFYFVTSKLFLEEFSR